MLDTLFKLIDVQSLMNQVVAYLPNIFSAVVSLFFLDSKQSHSKSAFSDPDSHEGCKAVAGAYFTSGAFGAIHFCNTHSGGPT